ncbi:MAG TPA: hypothetical protein VFW73_05615 [Lacipirellulaceae bacterium]|nr:hypothetical protein [Lacipirellulaceae bacterium]
MWDLYRQSEFETIQRDAYGSEGATPEQRTAMFERLMEAVEAFRAHLTPEERARRRRIADQLQPRPEPWWRNLRAGSLIQNHADHR